MVLGNHMNLADAAAKGLPRGISRRMRSQPSLMPLIRQLQASGIRTCAFTAGWNARGVRTARGAVWHPTTVHSLLARGALFEIRDIQRARPTRNIGFFLAVQ